MNVSPPDASAEGDDEEVVETDFVPGGWDRWDLTSSNRRSFDSLAGSGLSRRSSSPGDPSALLKRVIAEIVVTWRTDRGMPQREAAARLGVGQPWLSRIERSEAAVSLDLLVRLASATGSDVSIRIVPKPASSPVRRVARTGHCGRATVQFVVAGPEARA